MNSVGISYGSDMMFATLAPLGPVTLISKELAQLLEAQR